MTVHVAGYTEIQKAPAYAVGYASIAPLCGSLGRIRVYGSAEQEQLRFDGTLPGVDWCVDCLIVQDWNEARGDLVLLFFAQQEFAGRGGRSFTQGNWRPTWRAPSPSFHAMCGPSMSRPAFKAWRKKKAA